VIFSDEQSAPKAQRTKQVLAGLFLSRFDKEGLRALGFSSFTEAFNAIGFALGARPASIKNYRDEFDPLYSPNRKGWHKRPMREYCKAASDTYASMSLKDFTMLLKSLIYERGSLDIIAEEAEADAGKESSFAKRLITGQAAEKYFEVIHPTLPTLADYSLENVTDLGCGFDFRLRKSGLADFLAVEVKGLNDSRGTISLTEKEHRVASILSGRFYLFVVRNFREKPFHTIYCNPLKSELMFSRQETQVVQVNWRVSV
jgi:Domain of unknown function (DUF3883)